MSEPSLWERIRSAHIVQVGGVYLGGSWVVLQIIDTLQGLLELPDWVGPSAVALFLVGLPVVVATAWVQARPQTTAAEEAGEVPTDWEVAPGEALDSLSRGRLPHLTWGRALVGGFVALALLFGIAGLTVLLRTPGGFPGPAEAGAETAATGIAVLPFHMSGAEELDVYREGLVDLVSANLDGVTQFRAIDSRSVLARWKQDIGDVAEVEIERALRVAARTGARYAVVGNGVEAGPMLRLTASIYDVADGRRVGEPIRVEGSQEEILALVDELSVDVVRSVLDATGGSSVSQEFRLASLLTESVPALRHYLEGDASFRQGRFDDARDALQRAVEEDSTFALAHWRLGETWGWIEGTGSLRGRRYRNRARALSDRLPEREATLVELQASLGSRMSLDVMDDLRDYIARYPDDPTGWYLFGEAGLHAWTATGISDDELEEALYRLVELDPTFAPYYEHALGWATAKGHTERYEALVTALRETGDAAESLERNQLRQALFQGDDETAASAAARIAQIPTEEALFVSQAAGGLVDTDLERLEAFMVHQGDPRFPVVLYEQQGRLAEMVRVAADDEDRVLLEAVWRIGAWAAEGHVPEEVLRRLDEAVRSREKDGRNMAFVQARYEMDRLLGREFDREARAALRDSVVDGFVASLAASGQDTAGVRNLIRATDAAPFLVDEGRAEEAYEAIESGLRAVSIQPPPDLLQGFGYVALEAGHADVGASMLEGFSRSRHRTMIKLGLGRAYEALGDTAKALDAYRIFLSRTENADEQLGAVIEARRAVERLGG